MRENKFKAWDKRFKMFIYQLPNGYRIDLSGKIFIVDSAGKNFRESDDFELIQCTGIKDKNGVEIYEGDQLKFDPEEWGSEDSMFIVEWDDIAARYIGYGVTSEWPTYCEAVGNIYETPSACKG